VTARTARPAPQTTGSARPVSCPTCDMPAGWPCVDRAVREPDATGVLCHPALPVPHPAREGWRPRLSVVPASPDENAF
jgi:hypothetical protein